MERLTDFLTRRRKHPWMVSAAIFLAAIIPICFLVARTYVEDSRSASELVLSRRKAIAQLAANLLQERFESAIDLGTSLAGQADFQESVAAGNWDAAILDLDNARKNLDYIDSVILFDKSGTIKSISPAAPEVVGVNYGYRDYYLGVSKNWQPYVSEVFKRSAEPHYNVIIVAIPIRNRGTNAETSEVTGILAFSIKLDTLLSWARDVDVGDNGFVYFVDQHGNVTGHPDYAGKSDIVNFSTVPVVQKVLGGQSGVEVNENSIENASVLTGYAPIDPYGWGAIVEQPAETAFATARENVNKTLIENIIFLIIAAALVLFILRLFFTVSGYRQKESIFLESVGDGLIGINRSWIITLWNTAAERLTGWTREEAMGKSFRDIVKFISEETGEENIRFIEETMLFGKVHFMGNHTELKRRDGSNIAVGDSASPIFDSAGVVDGAIIIFRDISQERELEKAREEFSSLATHQLRTPITIINQYVELLEDTALTDQQKEELVEIKRASESLADLASGMLNITRIESGTIGISPEAAFIPDLLDASLKEVAPEMKKKGLAVKKTYAKDIPSIGVDVKLFGAIARNLLSNAIKYTPSGGSVSVAVEKTAQSVKISVKDTGIGIPEADQPKIFSKFFRAENAHALEIPGTGLGLYAIQTILRQAGGDVRFISTEGQGSTFTVTLPLSGMQKKEGQKGLV